MAIPLGLWLLIANAWLDAFANAAYVGVNAWRDVSLNAKYAGTYVRSLSRIHVGISESTNDALNASDAINAGTNVEQLESNKHAKI